MKLPLALLAALLCLPAQAQPAPDAPLDLTALMAAMADIPARHDAFQEERRLAQLTTPVLSSGTLTWRRPAYLEKATETPAPESMIIDGDSAEIRQPGQPPQRLDLGQVPQLRLLADAIRAPMQGNLAALRRVFTIHQAGIWSGWLLQLTPTDPAAARYVSSIEITGHATRILEILTLQANGDQDRLTIRPLP